MKPVRLRAAAKRDFREAIAWYQDRSEEIVDRFVAEVRRALELIEQFPTTGAAVPGVNDSQIRRLPVHNFPYHVIFLRLPDRTAVLAIAHDRRRPGYWR